MILVGLILIVAGLAYLLSPWVRQKVNGFKTYFFATLVAAGPTLDALNPDLLSTALNIDGRWKAALLVVLGVAVVWSHTVSGKRSP